MQSEQLTSTPQSDGGSCFFFVCFLNGDVEICPPVSSSDTHAADGGDDDVCVGVIYFVGCAVVSAARTTPDERWMELRVAPTSFPRRLVFFFPSGLWGVF